jgi:dTDP-4-amino-4,6-dideoxygalactose transaminase
MQKCSKLKLEGTGPKVPNAGPSSRFKVRYMDLPVGNRAAESAVRQALSRVVKSGSYILGNEVRRFEREFSVLVGAQYAVGVGNGLDAITLALKGLGVGPNDEVIVPAFTFIATWLGVSATGATPVPVDIEQNTYQMTAAAVQSAITWRTRAVVLVPLFGIPIAMEPFLALAATSGIRVVIDAAQAHGAKYCGAPVGSQGDAATWSFYPTKNLGALGDAGAVTSNHQPIDASVRRLRDYGRADAYLHCDQGQNSRLDELQAAILSARLPFLDGWNARRRDTARIYMRHLAALDLRLPSVPDGGDPVWHVFPIRCANRDFVVDELRSYGVECQIHYPTPPHLQPAYEHLGYRPNDFPQAEMAAQHILSLPIAPHLTPGEIKYVVEAVSNVVRRHPGVVDRPEKLQ